MKTSIALLGAIAIATAANAQVVFYDTFDSYPSQTTFSNAWSVGVSGGGLTLTKEQGSTMFDQSAKQLTTPGQSNGRDFTPTVASDAQQLVWSFQFYDSTQAGNLRQFATIRDNAPSLAQLVAIGAYNDTTLTKDRFTGQSVTVADLNTYYTARVAFFPGSTNAAANWFILNTPGVPTRTTGWHEMTAVFGSTNVSFYIDGILGMADVPYSATSGLVSFDRVTIGSGLSSANGVAYYDDVQVMVVPEPSTYAIAVIGGFIVLLARRMRR